MMMLQPTLRMSTFALCDDLALEIPTKAHLKYLFYTDLAVL